MPAMFGSLSRNEVVGEVCKLWWCGKKASLCKLSRSSVHEGSGTESQMNSEISGGNGC